MLRSREDILTINYFETLGGVVVLRSKADGVLGQSDVCLHHLYRMGRLIGSRKQVARHLTVPGLAFLGPAVNVPWFRYENCRNR
jgi:hypothetical protein